MINFIDQINGIISSSELATNRKVSDIKSILSDIKLTQIKKSIDDNDTTLDVIITYNDEEFEGAGICAKDINGWSFKPSRSKENGVASVKIIAKGDESTKETFFIITNLWKNRFFAEHAIEVPYFKVNL